MNSTGQANHYHVKSAGGSAGQSLNRVFERYTMAGSIEALRLADELDRATLSELRNIGRGMVREDKMRRKPGRATRSRLSRGSG